MPDPFTEPLALAVADGAVVIVGPDGLAAAFTPAAAEESAQRLLAAAEQARQQGDARSQVDEPCSVGRRADATPG